MSLHGHLETGLRSEDSSQARQCMGCGRAQRRSVKIAVRYRNYQAAGRIAGGHHSVDPLQQLGARLRLRRLLGPCRLRSRRACGLDAIRL